MKGRLVEEQREFKRRKYSESGCENETSTTLSKFQRASEHIITIRVFKNSWFSRTAVLDLEVSKLSKIVDGLLVTYKAYFDRVLEREPWRESTSLSDFRKITEDVLESDDENYNWTRIAMLLALGSRVGRHFYEAGATKEFVVKFSKDVGMCIEERVKTWPRKDDRWKALTKDNTEEGENTKQYVQLFGVGAAVVSFLATVANLSMSSTAFMNKIKN